jgi:hypothetical protein
VTRGSSRALSVPSRANNRARRRLLTRGRVMKAIGLVVLALVVAPALFIVVRCSGSGSQPASAVAELARGITGYARGESLTFLTLPEWFIVYSTEEYAHFIGQHRPSGFPYFGSIGQYWSYYGSVCAVTRREYAFDAGYNTMLGVIGTSFTVENVIKGLYENIVGRMSEWVGGIDTPEDALARRTALEYGAFMHTVPWYEFRFAGRLRSLWTDVPLWGPHVIRKWERRFALTAEYAVKAGYGWVIWKATKAAYGDEDLRIHAVVTDAPREIFDDPRVRLVRAGGDRSFVVTLPRYEQFTHTVLGLQARGIRFVDIAGNDEILVTAIVPAAMQYQSQGGVIASRPILTDASRKRIAVRAPVRSLSDVIAHLKERRGSIEHLYDY